MENKLTDIQMEMVVLGAILLESNSKEIVMEILTSNDDFSDYKHQLIYKAITEMSVGDYKTDILTVTNWLRKDGKLDIAGGAFYIVELTQKVNSAANIEYHSRILAELSIGRKMIKIAINTQERLKVKQDVFETLDYITKEIYNIEGIYHSKEPKLILELSKEAYKNALVVSKLPDGIIGERTHLQDFDRHTKGWRKSNLVIVGARPGMGKSSMAHSIAYNVAVYEKKPVAIFSLEMSSEEVTTVLQSYATGIDYERISSGEYINNKEEYDIFHEKIQPLLEAPIYIDDTASMSLMELRAKARKLVKKQGVTMIFIDYLQLMTVISDRKTNIGNREQEISTISRGLKAMAKELNVPVIALSQISREAEKRGNKKPILSDLRESGAIEQDADMVVFLFRPSYYFDKDESGAEMPKHLNIMIIAKYRGGKLGEINTKFIGRMKRFIDFEDTLDDNFVAPKQKSFFDTHNNTNKFDNPNKEFEEDKPF